MTEPVKFEMDIVIKAAKNAKKMGLPSEVVKFLVVMAYLPR